MIKVNPEYAQYRPYFKISRYFAYIFYPSRIKAVIHHIIAKNTIDERVMVALENKDTSQAALIEAVRAQIQKQREE